MVTKIDLNICRIILIIILLLSIISLTLFTARAEEFEIWGNINWGDSINEVILKSDLSESYYTISENDSMMLIVPSTIAYKKWIVKFFDNDLIDNTQYIAFRFDTAGMDLNMISAVINTECISSDILIINAYENLCHYYGSVQVDCKEDSFHYKWELVERNTNLILSDFGNVITFSMFNRKVFS